MWCQEQGTLNFNFSLGVLHKILQEISFNVLNSSSLHLSGRILSKFLA